MTIVATNRFQNNLQTILERIIEQLDIANAQNFKIYLDTIILNIPTKIQKYKRSLLFDDKNIKEIDFKGLKIFFYHDEINEKIIILSIA